MRLGRSAQLRHAEAAAGGTQVCPPRGAVRERQPERVAAGVPPRVRQQRRQVQAGLHPGHQVVVALVDDQRVHHDHRGAGGQQFADAADERVQVRAPLPGRGRRGVHREDDVRVAGHHPAAHRGDVPADVLRERDALQRGGPALAGHPGVLHPVGGRGTGGDDPRDEQRVDLVGAGEDLHPVADAEPRHQRLQFDPLGAGQADRRGVVLGEHQVADRPVRDPLHHQPVDLVVACPRGQIVLDHGVGDARPHGVELAAQRLLPQVDHLVVQLGPLDQQVTVVVQVGAGAGDGEPLDRVVHLDHRVGPACAQPPDRLQVAQRVGQGRCGGTRGDQAPVRQHAHRDHVPVDAVGAVEPAGDAGAVTGGEETAQQVPRRQQHLGVGARTGHLGAVRVDRPVVQRHQRHAGSPAGGPGERGAAEGDGGQAGRAGGRKKGSSLHRCSLFSGALAARGVAGTSRRVIHSGEVTALPVTTAWAPASKARLICSVVR